LGARNIEPMTRDEAVAQCAQFAAEHEDRATHKWIPRETADGGWEVAKIKVPAGLRLGSLKETVETKPKPPEPDDPRPAYWRNIGGPYA
jgi:hypothetical protein